jgi:hypothetical protein
MQVHGHMQISMCTFVSIYMHMLMLELLCIPICILACTNALASLYADVHTCMLKVQEGIDVSFAEE